MGLVTPNTYSAASAIGMPVPAEDPTNDSSRGVTIQPPTATAQASAQPPTIRVTWRDWEPSGTPESNELLTREEFIARLNAIHVDVDEASLRFWEYQGVLPRAVKRWSNGANRVFYPRWMLFTIALLRALQGIGKPLREISAHLEAATPEAVKAVRSAEKEDRREAENAERFDAIKGRSTSTFKHRHGGDRVLWSHAQKVAQDALRESLEADLGAIAKKYNAVTRRRVDLVRVSFHRKEGNELTQFDVYELPLGDETSGF